MATLAQVKKIASRNSHRELAELALQKVPTGIRGLDQVTHGGFPKGRTALVCGGPGAGKTLLGLEFLVRGATQFNEPGVCIAFEETA
jgi:circadian clock protein KaiC